MSSQSATLKRMAFVLGALLCVLPWGWWGVKGVGALALALGIGVGLAGWSSWPDQSKKVARWFMQGAIVALGLRLDIPALVGAAREGFLLALCTIGGALGVGLLLRRVLRIGRDLGLLISCGTAICGGSAIAAVGASIRAKSSDMAIATACIFVLNAVGVFTLPVIGHKLGMSEVQFGSWAGVAIHDMASVNAVSKDYHAGDSGRPDAGSTALDTANIVKLTRVIWLAPLAIAAALWWNRAAGADGGASATVSTGSKAWLRTMPWFILWFIAACVVRTLVPELVQAEAGVKLVTGCAFQVALFLIGSGVSVAALRQAGWRAMLLAVLLWVVLASATAVALLVGWA